MRATPRPQDPPGPPTALGALALARVRAGVAPEANRFAGGEDVHQGYARRFGPGPA